MIKLKRPKGFSASTNSTTVSIGGGHSRECTNLLKSGIIHQKIVLVEYNEQWHEIEVENMGLDNSDLESFKKHVESFNLTLIDLGIQQGERKQTSDHTLKHDDFMELQGQFPNFSYIHISHLYEWDMKHSYGKSGMYSIRQLLRILTERNIEIKDWIAQSEEDKKNHINNYKTTKMNPTEKRIEELMALGAIKENDAYVAFGFGITLDMIESLPDAAWTSVIDNVKMLAPKDIPTATAEQAFEKPDPVSSKKDREAVRMNQLTEAGFIFKAATGEWIKDNVQSVHNNEIDGISAEEWEKIINPFTEESLPAVPVTGKESEPATEKKKSPVSLETIGNLTPDRIADLAGLKSETERLLKENPVTEITTKAERDKLHKSVGIMLKASTALDGSTGIIALKNKFLKGFSATIDNFIKPETEARRKRHTELKAKVDAWDNAEELKKQAAEKAKLEKIKSRTDELFASGMVFNSENYQIGTLYIMPSQVEKSTDEEFSALVCQANEIKAEQDEAVKEQAKKDEVIINAAKQLATATGKPFEQVLAELTGKPYVPAPVESAPVQAETSKFEQAVAETAESTNSAPQTTAATSGPAPEKSTFVGRFVPSTEMTEPDPKDEALQKFDLDHLDVIENEKLLPSYIKCREYLKHGRRLLAADIRKILASDRKTKGAEIAALLDIVEK